MAIKLGNIDITNLYLGNNLINKAYLGAALIWEEASALVSDGLVLHLDASKTASYPGTGNTWFDIAGTEENGDIKSGVTYDAVDGGVMSFNGSSTGYVDISDSPTMAVGTGAFTVEMFVYYTNPYGFFSSAGSGGTGGIYGIAINSDKCWVGNSEDLNNSIPTSISTSTWVHLVYKRSADGLTTTLLINGTETGSATEATAFDIVSTSSKISARYNNNFIYGFMGKMGEFRFYTKELTNTEVQDNFNANRVRYGI